uniref:Ribonuclease P protein component n=1 Tax=Candidatus Aschnera chinzeii TaxID=1485666 RepID=A0AAT9G577_9ENTR|nr:MAG: ribonuclease P protein component [Candidatus Aschnera chinzeii]
MYTFSKKLKLSSYKEFEYVFQKPKFSYSKTMIIFGRFNFLKYPRLGISIPKKYVKYAHERNRIKRLVREYFRLHKNIFPSMDFVVLIKNSFININSKTITKKIEIVWHYYLSQDV